MDLAGATGTARICQTERCSICTQNRGTERFEVRYFHLIDTCIFSPTHSYPPFPTLSLPPFPDAGLRGLMVAHNEVNGLPLHGNKFILTEVIRNWFGSGAGSNNTGDALLIASDWGNVEQITSYGVAADQEHAAALAACQD